MTSRRILVLGLVLTLAGIVLAFVADDVAARLVPPQNAAYATAGTIASVFRQVSLTLGLVLLGTVPLARMLEDRQFTHGSGADREIE